jgi:hypothetical protein
MREILSNPSFNRLLTSPNAALTLRIQALILC